MHTRYLVLAGATSVLMLAACMTGCGHMNAQDDTPITIGDGSLTMESVTPWAKYGKPDANTWVHPNGGGAVASVVLTSGNNTRTISYSGQRCEVRVRYATTDIKVSTNNAGRALRVETDASAFHAGASGNVLVHNNASAKISHVTVIRGTQTMADSNASGGTKVVIHYR